ncbi:MAG: methylmalonyl Co-A mutase-associated GTPase MeaB, partial [Bacteroidota bacterium]
MKRFPANYYIEGIRAQDRFILSRAITLIESRRSSDRQLAQEVLTALMPEAGNSVRLGITGVPGVGKSTFIESFGLMQAERGTKVAVLAIDPSSPSSQGSILGDKTRMNDLSQHPNAFIRPSATGNSLGGVGQKTRETMFLCEAAGYELIIVETVGVGQSETVVRGMVDFFLLLMLPGAGDELQGIKRGIMEMADAIAINKSEGENQKRARLAQKAYQNALHLFPMPVSGWLPKVLTCSALQRENLDGIWEVIQEFVSHTKENDTWNTQRQSQNKDWFYEA